MLENPMVSGVGLNAIPFEDEPDEHCEACGCGMFYGETAYDWDGDWVCDECLVESVKKLSMAERSEMSGESIAYTEQILEDIYTADGYADVLNIDTKELERVW